MNIRTWVSSRLSKWLEPELFQPFVFGVLISLTLSEFVRGALTLSMIPTYGKSVLGFAVEWTSLALSIHYLADNLLEIPRGLDCGQIRPAHPPVDRLWHRLDIHLLDDARDHHLELDWQPCAVRIWRHAHVALGHLWHRSRDAGKKPSTIHGLPVHLLARRNRTRPCSDQSDYRPDLYGGVLAADSGGYCRICTGVDTGSQRNHPRPRRCCGERTPCTHRQSTVLAIIVEKCQGSGVSVSWHVCPDVRRRFTAPHSVAVRQADSASEWGHVQCHARLWRSIRRLVADSGRQAGGPLRAT